MQLEGPHMVRVCRESNTDLPIHSPAHYLYTISGAIMIIGIFYKAKQNKQIQRIVVPHPATNLTLK